MEVQRSREQGVGVVASRYTYVLKGGQGKDETCYASTSSSSTARGVPWTPGTNQVRPKLAVASCHVRDATQQQPDRVLVVAHLGYPFGLSWCRPSFPSRRQLLPQPARPSCRQSDHPHRIIRSQISIELCFGVQANQKLPSARLVVLPWRGGQRLWSA
jgi:hypothetical protein